MTTQLQISHELARFYELNFLGTTFSNDETAYAVKAHFLKFEDENGLALRPGGPGVAYVKTVGDGYYHINYFLLEAITTFSWTPGDISGQTDLDFVGVPSIEKVDSIFDPSGGSWGAGSVSSPFTVEQRDLGHGPEPCLIGNGGPDWYVYPARNLIGYTVQIPGPDLP